MNQFIVCKRCKSDHKPEDFSIKSDGQAYKFCNDCRNKLKRYSAPRTPIQAPVPAPIAPVPKAPETSKEDIKNAIKETLQEIEEDEESKKPKKSFKNMPTMPALDTSDKGSNFDLPSWALYAMGGLLIGICIGGYNKSDTTNNNLNRY